MRVENEAAGRDYVVQPINVKQNARRWRQLAMRFRHVEKMQAYKSRNLTIVLPVGDLTENQFSAKIDTVIK